MKVLFVCPFVPWPLESGGRIRTYNLIEKASAHAEIHLRVVREEDQAPEAEEALSAACTSLEFFDRARPGSLRRWLRPKLERWFHSPALHAAVRAELDGFHLVHLDELLLARIVPAGRKVPVVQHHHKLDTVLYDSLREGEGARRHFDLWKLRRLEAESARRYRHHLLCSQEDASILQGRYGALDCAVVPSGFDPGAFHPSEPAPERVPDRLVFVGTMDYGPNVDAMRYFAGEVLPRIAEHRPGVALEIVGANPTPEVRALASERVQVTGRVDRVPPYLERASLMVVPLRIGGGTRLKIIEALALGTPVVSTRTGAEGLGLEAGRHLVLADGTDELAAGIVRLLEDPATAARLGKEGRREVHERFRWEVLAEDLVDYWERVAFSGALSPSR